MAMMSWKGDTFRLESNTHQVRGLAAIMHERHRQDSMKAAGKFEKTCADPMIDHERNTVLGEEVGEVSKAILEKDPSGLREELAQTAAVCLAWLEGLDLEVEDCER